MTSSGETDPGMCPWCSAPVAEGATQCSECGAAVAQRESIGDLVIPGVTNVDPELESYAAQPLRIPGASPSQRIAGPAAGSLVMGGPEALLALGGLAAVAATEFLTAGGDAKRAAELERVGEPSGAVLEMVKKLDDKWAPPNPAAPPAEVGKDDAGSPAGPPESSGIY